MKLLLIIAAAAVFMAYHQGLQHGRTEVRNDYQQRFDQLWAENDALRHEESG